MVLRLQSQGVVDHFVINMQMLPTPRASSPEARRRTFLSTAKSR
jgi:hypothetical protein